MIAGGESVYGKPFKDEFHSRLRFVRRGLVAMANAGKDDNGSQFFFTMAATPELQNKHTIFGKVVGDTVYNMIRLQEGLVGPNDRPETPNLILKTKVISNPFPDVEPRRTITMEREGKKDRRPQSNMKATKDFSLLSFGDEAEEEEEDLDKASREFASSKGKSSHDILDDPKLSSEVGREYRRDEPPEEEEDEHPGRADPDVVSAESVRNKLKKVKDDKVEKKKKEKPPEEDFVAEGDEEDEELKAQERKREEIKREIRALTREMKRKSKRGEEEKASGPDDDGDGDGDGEERGGGGGGGSKKERALTEEEKQNDMLREFHDERSRYASQPKVPKKGPGREDVTMKLLEKFKSRLHSVKDKADNDGDIGGGAAAAAAAAANDVDDDVDGDDWMASSLRFQSETPVLAKDASTKDDDWFDIYDPRNPVNKRRRKEDAKKSSRRK